MTQQPHPTLEVCPSPALLHLHDISESLVVIIDVLRATSTIATALYNGAREVIPVASVPECIRIGEELGAVTAGERDGIIAEGLQHGNSPFEYPREFIQGRTLVLTTTNGTRLLHLASAAPRIITGSFVNLDAVGGYLKGQNRPVLLACAAWKDRVNLEDMLFAGAVISRVRDRFAVTGDAALIADQLYDRAKDDLVGGLAGATHFKRLSRHGLQKDIRYCMTPNLAPVLPLLTGGSLVDAATLG
jgi:2-phosphosulfolactate phosphatase